MSSDWTLCKSRTETSTQQLSITEVSSTLLAITMGGYLVTMTLITTSLAGSIMQLSRAQAREGPIVDHLLHVCVRQNKLN